MQPLLPRCAALLLFLPLLPPAAQAQPATTDTAAGPFAEATLASGLTERGIALWPQRPVAHAVLGWAGGTHWATSLAATTPLQGPDGPDQPATRWALHAAWHQPLTGDWLLRARLGGYGTPGYRWRRFYDHTEASLGAAWRDLLWLELAAVRLATGHQRATWAADLGLRWPLADALGGQLSAAAGLGRAELIGWPGWCYTYGDAGLAWQAGPWQAGVRAIGLRGERVRRLRGDHAAPHLATSVGYTF